MIQVFCNKNYKCPKKPKSKNDIETSEDSENESYTPNKRRPIKTTKKNEKVKKSKKRVSIQDHSLEHEDVICGQPHTCRCSICEKTNCPDTFVTCTHNKDSNVPPSFNLHTYQKSTPIRSSHNSKQNVPAHSQPTFSSNQIDTVIDVHSSQNEPDIQSDQTFYSLC